VKIKNLRAEKFEKYVDDFDFYTQAATQAVLLSHFWPFKIFTSSLSRI